jgi:hypothetical protein
VVFKLCGLKTKPVKILPQGLAHHLLPVSKSPALGRPYGHPVGRGAIEPVETCHSESRQRDEPYGTVEKPELTKLSF